MSPAAGAPRAWPVRLAIAAALLGYAGLAVASGFDRSARDNPGLGEWVPQSLQAATPAASARRFVESGLPGAAFGDAQAALRASPVEPGNAALLGTALLARGDERGADKAFRLAAKLGWREPLTQMYWLETALAAGDAPAAVLRFDALARQYPQAPAMAQAAARLEASEAGRTALAQRMARGANWAASYAMIDGASGADRVRARGEVLASAARLGLRLGCDPVARITRALGDIDPLLGATLWREHCPDAGASGAIADGGFAAFDPVRQRVPFEWALAGHGDLSASLIDGKRGKALQLANGGAATIPVLVQLVPLSPGSYRIVWQGDATGRLRAELSCSREELAPPADGRPGQVFTVDASCPARWLRFWLAPGADPVMLDDVALERI